MSQSTAFDPDNTLPPISSSRTKDAMAKLPSPPVTPATQALRKIDRRHSDEARDPVLFSGSDSIHTLNDQPLFPPSAEKLDANLDAIVSEHMAMHMHQFSSGLTKPTRDEYLLALACVPIVEKKYAQNPRKWFQQERRILDERFGNANRVWKRPGVPTLAKIAPAPSNGFRRQSQTTRAVRQPRAPRPPKRTPQSKIYDSFNPSVGNTPKRVIGTSREDTDFASLPDYCPPLSTLPSHNSKILKADWKGQALDLSSDPHRDLLHESEVNLAATLRLSCATYLCSKRRIFMARLDALKIGKEFRKTDSQQACKIDVNKASKLWTAYDRVGWFNPSLFRQYL